MGLGFLFVLIYFSTIVEIEKATTDKKEREEKEEGGYIGNSLYDRMVDISFALAYSISNKSSS